MQNAELKAAAASVPAIEVADAAPSGAKRFAGPYYSDESAKLKETLQGLRDRAQFIVAPDGNGEICIYRRPRK